MKVIGYIRVSTDKQDFQQQKYSLLNYTQKKELKITDFIEVGLDVSSIRKLVNPHLSESLSYQSFKYHIEHHPELSEIHKMKILKARL